MFKLSYDFSCELTAERVFLYIYKYMTTIILKLHLFNPPSWCCSIASSPDYCFSVCFARFDSQTLWMREGRFSAKRLVQVTLTASPSPARFLYPTRAETFFKGLYLGVHPIKALRPFSSSFESEFE